jgi:hypothetical protein
MLSTRQQRLHLHHTSSRFDSSHILSLSLDSLSLSLGADVPIYWRQISADIPFVIDVPFDGVQFAALLDGRSPAEAVVIVDRIRASNHIALGPENRAKMQVGSLSLSLSLL